MAIIWFGALSSCYLNLKWYILTGSWAKGSVDILLWNLRSLTWIYISPSFWEGIQAIYRGTIWGFIHLCYLHHCTLIQKGPSRIVKIALNQFCFKPIRMIVLPFKISLRECIILRYGISLMKNICQEHRVKGLAMWNY